MLRRVVPSVQPRALALLTAGALALGGCGSSSGPTSTTRSATTASTATTSTQPAAPGTVTGSSGALTATLLATTHAPKVNKPWPIHITALENGSPATATVVYEYLFGGAVVAHRSHYTFTGHFSDKLLWPASAVGYQLTFRAVVTSAGAKVNLDYPVQVSG